MHAEKLSAIFKVITIVISSSNRSQFATTFSNWLQFATTSCVLSFVVFFAIPISFYIIVQRNNIRQDKAVEQTFVVDSSRLLSFVVE